MEWELLILCNVIGLLILFLVFLYHFADLDRQEAKK